MAVNGLIIFICIFTASVDCHLRRGRLHPIHNLIDSILYGQKTNEIPAIIKNIDYKRRGIKYKQRYSNFAYNPIPGYAYNERFMDIIMDNQNFPFEKEPTGSKDDKAIKQKSQNIAEGLGIPIVLSLANANIINPVLNEALENQSIPVVLPTAHSGNLLYLVQTNNVNDNSYYAVMNINGKSTLVLINPPIIDVTLNKSESQAKTQQENNKGNEHKSNNIDVENDQNTKADNEHNNSNKKIENKQNGYQDDDSHDSTGSNEDITTDTTEQIPLESNIVQVII